MPSGATTIEHSVIEADLAEVCGYVNRSPPDGELDGFVDALATRIAKISPRVTRLTMM
jgi:enoyl-CoA hydratase/carnithine racemase